MAASPGAVAAAGARWPPLESAVVAVALAILVVLAWWWVWLGAGSGMSALDMTALALFPHRLSAMDMPGEAFSWAPAIAMWWVMMIAMMTPSASPLVLLHVRAVHHAAGRRGACATIARPLALAAGYLAVWLAFSVAAAALQRVLQPSGLVSPMMLWSRSAWLSAAVLGCAGVYQLSPLKQRCLARCRGPVAFIARHWRPGVGGAFAMGIRHGAWCVACCGPLMALLFVGGLMNLAWIAALTVLVLVEKFAPRGAWAGRLAGIVLLAWAVATLLA